MTPIDIFLGALQTHDCHPREVTAGHWMARCPAHDDKDPSLSVDVGDDGRVLAKCFAGCTFAAICAALGVAEKDTFPPRDPPSPPAKKVNIPGLLARARANLSALARSPIAPSVDWLPLVQLLEGGILWRDKARGHLQALALPICDPDGHEVGAKLRFLGDPAPSPKSKSIGKAGILGYHLLAKLPEAPLIVAAGEKDLLHGLWVCPDRVWLSPSSGEGQSLLLFRDLLTSRGEPTWVPDVDGPGREGVAKVVGELRIPARAAWLPLDGSPASKDLSDYLLPSETVDAAGEALGALLDGAGPYAPDAPPDDSSSLDGDLADDPLARDMTRSPTWPPARHVAAWGRWLLWDGSRWREDTTLHHMTLTRSYLRQRAEVVLSSEHETDRDAAKAVGLARSILSARTVVAVAGLARSNPEVSATVEEWDCDPWLLGTPGGTVDLRTGELRPARPEDKITKLAGCTPAPPGACAYLWDSFLARIADGLMPLEDYLRRFAGYALTGSVREHVFPFLHGEGQNGKSVFINILGHLLGDYSVVISTEMLMAAQNPRHPTEIARLRGVRLAIGSETEEGQAWAEAKIKHLTGGDRLSGRFMRQDLFDFDPQFKLLVIGNKRPSLRGVDKAIRRRLHLVPFLVTIPEAERDKLLEEKLRAEAPTILRWAIDGCLEWQRIGLAPPEIVTEATDSYLDEEDVIEQWMTDSGRREDGHFENSYELWLSWSEWAKSAGEPVGTRTRFGRKLKGKGLVSAVLSGGIRGWRGFRLHQVRPGGAGREEWQTDPDGWKNG